VKFCWCVRQTHYSFELTCCIRYIYRSHNFRNLIFILEIDEIITIFVSLVLTVLSVQFHWYKDECQSLTSEVYFDCSILPFPLANCYLPV
jgi:hypothetical protein